MKSTALLLTLFAALVLPGQTAGAPLKVFIFAGQSNMLGKRSQADQLPEKFRGEQKNVLFWDTGEWKSYSPGVGQNGGFGAEVSCGLELAKALGEPVGMIKHSVGGTNLANQWNPENARSLYQGLKAKVEAAAGSRPIEVAGMFWMQGESDATRMEMSEPYSKNLDAFIQRSRRDFKNPDMIFISGRVNSMTARFTGIEIVRKAQEKEREHYGWTDLDELPKVGDQVHYDTEGIAEMGLLFAKKFLALASSAGKSSN